MKLINADNLVRTVGYYRLRDGEDIQIRYVAIEQIDNAPTVDAIPTEWIKNYVRHKASKGFTEIDCYWQFWEDDVLKMVADWEKENEKS